MRYNRPSHSLSFSPKKLNSGGICYFSFTCTSMFHCSFTLYYPLALLIMNRMTSDKQSGVEFLYLYFCCTPNFKFSCKAIIKMAQFHQTVEKILCNRHWRKTDNPKLQKVSKVCVNVRKQSPSLGC